jgi:hypothetical protein
MATRRKYKTGGAVIPDESSEPATPAKAPEDAVDGLRQVLDAQKAAEAAAMQRREAGKPPEAPLEQRIDAMPVDSRIKTFLKRNPHVLAPQNADAVAWHHHLAQRAGIEDGSDAMHQRILDGIAQEHELIRQRRAEMAERAMPTASAPPITRPADVDAMAEQLGREASAIGMTMNAEASTPEAVAENLPPMPDPAPRKKSIPYGAAPSRNVPSYSGKSDTSRSVTLTAEERGIARNSYHWMGPDAAEREYAHQKAKMLGLKEKGEIQ